MPMDTTTSPTQIWVKILGTLIVALNATVITSFQPSVVVTGTCCRERFFHLNASEEGEDDEEWRKQLDGGGDLTDRFKHKVSSEFSRNLASVLQYFDWLNHGINYFNDQKVHALMGTYDPPPGTTDDENQMGHITGALLQFPTDYTFSVVGKTSDGDSYANDVKSLVESILGSDARMETRVVPRGAKFTKVSVKVNVESAAMITSIYAELDSMERTVMKF